MSHLVGDVAEPVESGRLSLQRSRDHVVESFHKMSVDVHEVWNRAVPVLG